MTATLELPEQLVYLVIRFATSIPDLPLAVRSPQITTTLSLKQLIRPRLPAGNATSRLRLIYAGKVLADGTPLSASLRLPPPLPHNEATSEIIPEAKGKGKQPMRHVSPLLDNAEMPSDAKRYYIHCSLGDTLSSSELASEAALAENTEASLKSQYRDARSERSARRASVASDRGTRRPSSPSAPSTAPQGFDRLLGSGFTAQEVATLRSQFQTNLSYTHTPDTMPSALEMRALEDRWLDSTATDPSAALTTEAGETGWGAGFAVEEGGLDDMLWGYLTGFFWPLGALIWGFREEGLWARRRQVAVVMGVVLNTAFGFMRWSQ